MATRRAKATTQKAQVSQPIPGVRPNFSVLGVSRTGEALVIDRSRKARYATYYEMFKQHPTVRAGVEKIAKVAEIGRAHV